MDGNLAGEAPVEQPVRPAQERTGLVWELCLLAQVEEFSDEVRCTIQRGANEIERLRACLHEVLEFQSDPKAPTIHDFGRWRRAADGLKA